MITLHLQKNTIGDDLERLVDRIANPGNAQRRAISGAIRREFQSNFTSQRSGNGQWPALAPATVADRRRRGFAGNRPILVRSGSLRNSYVSNGSPDHYSNVRQSGGYTIFEEGSEHPIALFHERGTSRMPARPVSLLGDSSESRLFDVVEYVVAQIEREALK